MTQEPPQNPLDMPGSIRLTLYREWSHSAGRPTADHFTAGETVFYNSNLLHCARYSSKKRRATLHGCMGDVRGGSTRARNVLQHGLRWMREDRFRAQLDEVGQAMARRLAEMEEKAEGNALGYSLSN